MFGSLISSLINVGNIAIISDDKGALYFPDTKKTVSEVNRLAIPLSLSLSPSHTSLTLLFLQVLKCPGNAY